MRYDVIMRTDESRPYEAYLTCLAIDPDIIVKNELPFVNYLACESRATTDIYVISDDDIIPAHRDSLFKLCEQLEKYPEVGALGLATRKGIKHDDVSGWIRGGAISEDIFDVDHVGSVFAIRKGIMQDEGERPDFAKGYGDDQVLCRQLRRKGYKIGLYTADWFIHLGESKSTLWS